MTINSKLVQSRGKEVKTKSTERMSRVAVLYHAAAPATHRIKERIMNKEKRYFSYITCHHQIITAELLNDFNSFTNM